MKKFNKKLVLADGTVYNAYGHAADVEAIAEVVFNTSMVGYQEIATDPSYKGQIVILTYPIIGSYGINEDDYESKSVKLSGFVVREYNDHPSNFRSINTFGEMLTESNVPLISGIDTRALTRHITQVGSMKALITDFDTPIEECMDKLNNFVAPTNQVSEVSTKKKYVLRTRNPKYHVVCLDFGTKQNILRNLVKRGCNVTVVPYDTTAEEIMKLDADGLFLSNGPGDPVDNPIAIKVVQDLTGKLPIFGICLGHQIISLACGATTYKMKFGHRGSNHPVKNLASGRVEITSQNHSYAVDSNSVLNTDLEVTHVNILDNTVEGIRIDSKKLFSVQYHPESAAGPEDSEYLFETFINYMEQYKGAK